MSDPSEVQGPLPERGNKSQSSARRDKPERQDIKQEDQDEGAPARKRARKRVHEAVAAAETAAAEA
eukprot:1248062-Pyramimonas_sp.AAC.1